MINLNTLLKGKTIEELQETADEMLEEIPNKSISVDAHEFIDLSAMAMTIMNRVGKLDPKSVNAIASFSALMLVLLTNEEAKEKLEELKSFNPDTTKEGQA